MKQKYTVLGAGVLLLVFMVWLLTASSPAQIAIMLRSMDGAESSRFFNYALLGGAELLLIVPLIVYMAITGTSLAAMMGNRTTVRQNLAAALLGVLLVPAMNGIDTFMVELFKAAGANMVDVSSMIIPESVPELLVGMLAIGVAAGVVEEPIFRGVALRGMAGAAGKRTALLLSAIVFSLIHGDLVGAPSRFAVGLVLGMLAWRSGALLPGILTHAAYNSTILALSLAMNTYLPGWQGFAVPGASPAVAAVATWTILSLPFLALSFGVYRLFGRVSPVTARWSDRPHAAGKAKPAHYICWAALGVLTLGIIFLNTIMMWLPKDMIQQASEYLR